MSKDIAKKARKLVGDEVRDRVDPLNILLTMLEKRHVSGDEEGSVAIAGICLPYTSPRLASTEVKAEHTVTQKVISPEPSAEDWLARHAPQNVIEHDASDNEIGGTNDAP